VSASFNAVACVAGAGLNVMQDEAVSSYLLEVNTVPRMTDTVVPWGCGRRMNSRLVAAILAVPVY